MCVCGSDRVESLRELDEVSAGFGVSDRFGYQKTTLKEIEAIMDAKGIDLLVDVRSWPYSRNPMKQEFNKNQLSKRFGRR